MKIYERDKFLLDAKMCNVVKEYVPSVSEIEKLSDFFSALSDGTRLRILSALSITPMCVNDLSGLLNLNQTTVSHQLRALRSVGAVSCRRQGRISFYSLKNRKLLDIMLNAVEHVSQ